MAQQPNKAFTCKATLANNSKCSYPAVTPDGLCGVHRGGIIPLSVPSRGIFQTAVRGTGWASLEKKLEMAKRHPNVPETSAQIPNYPYVCTDDVQEWVRNGIKGLNTEDALLRYPLKIVSVNDGDVPDNAVGIYDRDHNHYPIMRGKDGEVVTRSKFQDPETNETVQVLSCVNGPSIAVGSGIESTFLVVDDDLMRSGIL